MSLKSSIVAQFRQPTGGLGALAGRIMAARPSNRLRNEKTVDIMGLQSDSSVLEIGCGPGLALSKCASIATNGRLVGLDHSDVMIRQARHRLRKQRADEKVELIVGGMDRLSDWPATFDFVFSLNVIQFQQDKFGFFRAVAKALAPGGSCLTTYQPRLDADGTSSSRDMIDAILEALGASGFARMDTTEIIGGPTPAICVRGIKAIT